MSVNKVFLIGNLGADPETKRTADGQPMTKFRMATTAVWNDKEGARQERTDWHRVTVWGREAEVCGEHLVKGRRVHVEGRLHTSSWQDKETAEKRYSTEVVADRVTFLGPPGGRNSGEDE